ncbi:invasion associated locus B family protein [Microvirga sp. W0021]|uniref:Invasion associated locus B family protein n=1 Tax=Hohaiivirga grylli TaxID=3133970 RepID=A0ABV0BQC1_9HYPH
MKPAFGFAMVMVFCGSFASAAETGGDKTAAYRIKPSEVSLPADVPLGQYKRTFQPFENWILVCDENLKAKRKVCNASQSIEDAEKRVVFSWSLAASQDGDPYMIVRTLPDADVAKGVSLDLSTGPNFAKIKLDGCNDKVCVGKTAVGPVLSGQISKGAPIRISYQQKDGNIITMLLPLKGLQDAVNAIQ